MTPSPFRLGIISALQQEQAGLIDTMQMTKSTTRGMRNYIDGKLWDVECVCVLSRIGKVAAATTAAMLIEKFNVTHIVFTGVAGATDVNVQVGDIVIAEELVQYDMDASPLFPRFQVPLTGLSHFASDIHLTNRLIQAAENFIRHDFHHAIDTTDRNAFQLEIPRVHRGLIASGDEFIDDSKRHLKLKSALPGLLAVEMEGAAVAQVCFEFGIPFSVIRTISDGANENSSLDFMHFIDRVAARYAFNIIKRFCFDNQNAIA